MCNNLVVISYARYFALKDKCFIEKDIQTLLNYIKRVSYNHF